MKVFFILLAIAFALWLMYKLCNYFYRAGQALKIKQWEAYISTMEALHEKEIHMLRQQVSKSGGVELKIQYKAWLDEQPVFENYEEARRIMIDKFCDNLKAELRKPEYRGLINVSRARANFGTSFIYEARMQLQTPKK